MKKKTFDGGMEVWGGYNERRAEEAGAEISVDYSGEGFLGTAAAAVLAGIIIMAVCFLWAQGIERQQAFNCAGLERSLSEARHAGANPTLSRMEFERCDSLGVSLATM